MKQINHLVPLYNPQCVRLVFLILISILLIGFETKGIVNAFQTSIPNTIELFHVRRSIVPASTTKSWSCIIINQQSVDDRLIHWRSCNMKSRYQQQLFNSNNNGEVDITNSNSIRDATHDDGIDNDITTTTTGESTTQFPVEPSTAAINTVNERLLLELQQATAIEKSGNRNIKNNRLKEVASFFKSSKTDDERKAAIIEAQNLNGINPLSTFFGAIFAIVCSIGLWYGTQSLALYFILHPTIDTDMYIIQRVTIVSRNIVMGLIALASGFFGVTGIGILLLAFRVGYGVVIGELDPTPIVKDNNIDLNNNNSNNKVDIGNVWDMMLNKSNKKGRR